MQDGVVVQCTGSCERSRIAGCRVDFIFPSSRFLTGKQGARRLEAARDAAPQTQHSYFRKSVGARI